MSSTAHRFGAGHRLRVQLSAGAHPRFARNTGTPGQIATATSATVGTRIRRPRTDVPNSSTSTRPSTDAIQNERR